MLPLYAPEIGVELPAREFAPIIASLMPSREFGAWGPRVRRRGLAKDKIHQRLRISRPNAIGGRLGCGCDVQPDSSAIVGSPGVSLMRGAVLTGRARRRVSVTRTERIAVIDSNIT